MFLITPEEPPTIRNMGIYGSIGHLSTCVAPEARGGVGVG